MSKNTNKGMPITEADLDDAPDQRPDDEDRDPRD